MLDKKSLKVLKVLNSICEEGTYKVIDYNNLIEKFGTEKKTTKLGLDQILDHLKLGQYIDIKYAENNTYCLSVLPKGRVIFEEESSLSKTKFHTRVTAFFTIMCSGIMAFLGAFLAVYLYFRGVR